MSEKKNYIRFTNSTPNDQGSIVPNEAIDFTRYKFNPVILRDHNWTDVAIGMMEDIHLEDGSWKGLPNFHGLNDESKLAKAMYEGGDLVSASIGGDMILKAAEKVDPLTNQIVSEPFVNEQGYKVAEKFTVFEISFPTLPSNYMAVTDNAIEKGQKDAIKMGILEASNRLGTKIFAHEDEEKVFSSMVTLSKQFNDNQKLNAMTDEEKQAKKEADKKAADAAKLASEKEAADKKAAEDATKDKSHHVVLEAGEMPGFVKRLIDKKGLLGAFLGTLYKDPDDDDKPQTTDMPGKGDLIDLPEDGKLSAKTKAEEAVKKVEAAKAKYDDADDEEKEKFKAEYEACIKEADKLCKEAEAEEKAEEEAKAKKEAEESAAKKKEEEEAKAKKEASKNAAQESEKIRLTAEIKNNYKPIKQTMDELAKLSLAPDPAHATRMAAKDGVSFTQLRADKKDGEQILGRIFSGTKSNEKFISDYAVLLNSILNDKKYAPVISQMRFMPSASMESFGEQRKVVNANPNARYGFDVKAMAARLSRGETLGVDMASGAQGKRTLLTSDGVFSSLDTAAVEWLTLILYKLFPSEDWKNEIPVLPAEQTGRNVGVIWTNIAANPTISRGTTPAPAGDYGPYADTSVGMKLVPYWMSPMLWTPMSMHLLRYDQMGSGWAQGLAKLNAQIGDDLLYTLLYGLYTNQIATSLSNIIYSQGWSTAPATNQVFNIPASGSKFIFNSSFAGNLVKPGFNDVLAIEELFALQNFDLARERAVLVIDSSMDRWLSSDPETKSLLTRWINDQGAEVLKIKNTLLHARSRVGAFDLPSTTVIDTNAAGVSIPSTTMSAALGFIASQVAIGLGLIDVFMIQDPANYGYRMSLDLRINARALRSDYTGLAMYTYGAGQSSGS